MNKCSLCRLKSKQHPPARPTDDDNDDDNNDDDNDGKKR
jgi:hypothetical protein